MSSTFIPYFRQYALIPLFMRNTSIDRRAEAARLSHDLHQLNDFDAID